MNTYDCCNGSGRLVRLTLKDIVPYVDNSDPELKLGSHNVETKETYI